jgi:hypothetical protein
MTNNTWTLVPLLKILFVSNSQCWWMCQTFIKMMNSIHILVVVRLGFRSGNYLGLSGN